MCDILESIHIDVFIDVDTFDNLCILKLTEESEWLFCNMFIYFVLHESGFYWLLKYIFFKSFSLQLYFCATNFISRYFQGY